MTSFLFIQEVDQMNQSFCCKVQECGEAFPNRSEALKHAKKHAELDPFDFVCDHCGKKFLGIANMKRHLRVHMGSEGKDFACPLCHYRGCTTTHVKRHMAHKHLEKFVFMRFLPEKYSFCFLQVDSLSLLFVHGCDQC